MARVALAVDVMGGDNSKFDDVFDNMLEQQKKCAAGDGEFSQI